MANNSWLSLNWRTPLARVWNPYSLLSSRECHASGLTARTSGFSPRSLERERECGAPPDVLDAVRRSCCSLHTIDTRTSLHFRLYRLSVQALLTVGRTFGYGTRLLFVLLPYSHRTDSGPSIEASISQISAGKTALARLLKSSLSFSPIVFLLTCFFFFHKKTILKIVFRVCYLFSLINSIILVCEMISTAFERHCWSAITVIFEVKKFRRLVPLREIRST